jgi:hypothetical protein
MPKGGKRVGAGNKFKWNSGKTRVIRVPETIAEQVIEYAHFLDSGGVPTTPVTHSTKLSYDGVTQSKNIDLSGILIRSYSNQPVVMLSDLVRVGYQILPEKLMQSPSLKTALLKQERTALLKEAINDESNNINLVYE